MIKQRLTELVQEPERLLDLVLPIALQLAAAIAIFYIGRWAVNGLIKIVRRLMHRGSVDETLADFLSNVLYGVAITIVVISALHQVGVETTSLAAMLGGAALAIGLSLQQQLSSLAAGVIIILSRPFKKGDSVEIGSGIKGNVEEIKIVHTRLRTLDNREVLVPNSSITTNTITNFTARGMRRIDLVIGISYDSDLLKTKVLLREILDNEKRVLKEPASLVEVKDLAASSVEFNVLPWVRTSDYADVRASLLETIKLRFDREKIVLPYPQMDLHVRHEPK
jgi:small conductance mechanosensitive channel